MRTPRQGAGSHTSHTCLVCAWDLPHDCASQATVPLLFLLGDQTRGPSVPCLPQVPLILYAHWYTNWAHVFCQAAGWLYTVLQRRQSALGGRVQLVVATPAGLGLPPSIRALLQPLSAHPVVTLSE